MENRENQRLQFDFSTVFNNTKRYIDQYNARQTRLTDKLNANHRATAEMIIRLYLKQLKQAENLDILEMENFPGFGTYNSSLAKCKGCTKRTIINHRERLLRAGFVTHEKHRGSGGMEMWINPEVLGFARPTAYPVDKIVAKGDVATFFSSTMQNFHPLVHEPQEQNNINSSVDKSGVRSAHSQGLSGVLSNPSPVDQATRTVQEPDKNMEKNAAPASKQKQCSEKKQEQVSEEAGRIFLLPLVRQFWEYAKKVLYTGLILSEPEEREILNMIWASVYGKLRLKSTEAEWLKYHDSAIARVDIVARWLSRNYLHWIPRPHLYFHPHNDRNGFKNTWSWYVKQETLKIEVRNQLLIQQIKSEWRQHRVGKGRLKSTSRLQLFHIQKKRLAKYKDESLMQAYHQSLNQSLNLKKLNDHAF